MSKPVFGEVFSGPVAAGVEFLGRRDAFHVPGVLVQCNEDVFPGEAVRFADEDLSRVVLAPRKQAHALVDPFIIGTIEAGKVFWVLPVPGVVTDLTHQFSAKVDLTPVEFDRDFSRRAGEPGYATDEDSESALECKGCY